MRKKQNSKKLLYLLLTLFLLVITIISGQDFLPAFAKTVEYSGALTDLLRDSTFNISDYPSNPTDYSIQVIQIAESKNGELFVYTYQPCQSIYSLVATEINMSLSDKFTGEVAKARSEMDGALGGFIGGAGQGNSDTVDSTKLYKLTQVSVAGVFAKYIVNGFNVSSAAERYYNITSIYREWIKGIDEETGNDNEINSVAFEVAKLWTATTNNGVVNYHCSESEVVTIVEKYVDFLRYTEGYWLWRDACDSHYVAFSADYDIERLYEAEVYYAWRDMMHSHSYFFGDRDNYKCFEEGERLVTLSEIDTGHTTVTGLGGRKHTWNRIEKVSDFINKEDLNDETIRQLNGKQWVLRFADTSYSYYPDLDIMSPATDKYDEYYTEVSEVTILRLKFETDGKVYNLGVVDNKQTGDNIPGNRDTEEDFNFWRYVLNCIVKLFTGKASGWETFVAILAIVLAVVVFVFVIKFVKWLYHGIFK